MRFGSITTEIIADGLVFNMDAANRASHVNGNTNTFNTTNLSQPGNLKNDVTFIPSPTPSFEFDGADDYIIFDSFPLDSSATDMTMSTWIKIDADTGTWQGICDGISDYLRTRIIIANDRTGIQCSLSSNGSLKSVPQLQLDTWYNITVTKNTSGAFIYIDGVYITADVSQNGSLTGSSGMPSSKSGITLASGAIDVNTFWLNGNISFLKIYDRALSSTEVLHNYNALKGRFGLS